MARIPGIEYIYDLGKKFVDSCLFADESLLWSGTEVWNLDNLAAIKSAFIESPELGSDPFLIKLKRQLTNESLDVHRIAADLVSLYNLYADWVRPETKLAQVNEIISWKLDIDVPDNDLLEEAFEEGGIASPGRWYINAKYAVLGYFIDLAIEIKTSGFKKYNPFSDLTQSELVSFESLADKVKYVQETDASSSRNILMYLLFPDEYEPIALQSDKEAINEAFSYMLPDVAPLASPTEENDFGTRNSIDGNIYQIRRQLTEQQEEDFENFSFYEEGVLPMWAQGIARFNETEATTEETPLQNSRVGKPFTGKYWVEKVLRHRSDQLNAAMTEEAGGSPAFQYEFGKHLWSPNRSSNGGDVYRLMREVQEGDIVFHLTDNTSFVGTSRVKTRYEERSDVIYGGNTGPSTYDETGKSSYIIELEDYTEYEPPFSREDFFANQIKENLVQTINAGFTHLFFFQHPRTGNLQLNQGMYISQAPPILVNALQNGYWDTHGEDFNPLFLNTPNELESSEQVLAPSIEDLSEYTYTDVSELEELEDLLESHRQIIFEGPPGTGKTFLAKAMARYITGNPLEGTTNNQVRIVQFHQSYGYEDFVQGIRPETGPNGELTYNLRNGVFKTMCEEAEKSDNPFVIVVDEINRGNLSRIFGELMLLLEYRDMEITLSNSTPKEPPFRIPPNVYLIGTMNSADRSLAQIDYALRRRFKFHKLVAVDGYNALVFSRWLAEAYDDSGVIGPGLLKSIDLRIFVKLNQMLTEELGQDFQIGQSYFMSRSLCGPTDDGNHNDGAYENLWKYSIIPLLGEYFFGARNRADLINDFSYNSIVDKVWDNIPTADIIGYIKHDIEQGLEREDILMWLTEEPYNFSGEQAEGTIRQAIGEEEEDEDDDENEETPGSSAEVSV